MGNALIAFLVAVGAATWIYTKLSRSTGGNTKNAAIATIISAVCIFGVVMLLLGLIPSS